MDVTLKVLEGAKSGAKIAVKKAEFIIGRSQSCHLCAGSSAISRQHCVIRRDGSRVSIQDLGSRNGTLVNGVKADGEVELSTGDEVVVGPLKFLVSISAGINNVKKPEVRSVAEAVARTADSNSGSVGDDEISKWLLGPASALSETQTIRIDDTNAMHKLREVAKAEEEKEQPAEEAVTDSEDDGETTEIATPSQIKKGGKPAPGKLPKFPDKSGAKDSREAAVEALRAWSRRR